MVPATTRSRAITTAPASARGQTLSHTLISKREVDDKYEWMDEASYKPVDGPLPVSKRQQKKGLGPSAYISVFNSIEALEKNYLAQSPSHSLTDPVLR